MKKKIILVTAMLLMIFLTVGFVFYKNSSRYPVDLFFMDLKSGKVEKYAKFDKILQKSMPLEFDANSDDKIKIHKLIFQNLNYKIHEYKIHGDRIMFKIEIESFNSQHLFANIDKIADARFKSKNVYLNIIDIIDIYRKGIENAGTVKIIKTVDVVKHQGKWVIRGNNGFYKACIGNVN